MSSALSSPTGLALGTYPSASALAPAVSHQTAFIANAPLVFRVYHETELIFSIAIRIPVSMK